MISIILDCWLADCLSVTAAERELLTLKIIGCSIVQIARGINYQCNGSILSTSISCLVCALAQNNQIFMLPWTTTRERNPYEIHFECQFHNTNVLECFALKNSEHAHQTKLETSCKFLHRHVINEWIRVGIVKPRNLLIIRKSYVTNHLLIPSILSFIVLFLWRWTRHHCILALHLSYSSTIESNDSNRHSPYLQMNGVE